MTPGAPDAVRLNAERAAAAARVADLSAEFAALVIATDGANTDDEHDPEGATIGFERAQLAAVLDQARDRVAGLDDALARLRTGGYGVCERCGDPIGDERLAARPGTTRCVSCAAAGG